MGGGGGGSGGEGSCCLHAPPFQTSLLSHLEVLTAHSCVCEHCDVVAVVSFVQTDGLSPLFFAAQYGRTEVVRALLEAGAGVSHSKVRESDDM